MFNCIIVDDEMPAREELKYQLKNFNNIKVIAESDNGFDALEKIKKLNPDLVFLDIQMPQMDGIKVAEEILKENISALIIFVTAYDEFAVKAFEVNAIDYLLKPISEERLEKSIDKITGMYNDDRELYSSKIQEVINKIESKGFNDINMISVMKSDKIIPLNLDEIIYSTVENRDTVIFSTKGKYLYNDTLTQLNNLLSGGCFFRCHRSYIINLRYVKEIEPWFNCTYQIRLEGAEELIPVSRNKVKAFKRIMNIK
ncbi:LytR/AlgR family response regulator transcription factor [Sporosalibacterium faouarense]|uniref:LytR/AlgR family response regulator transcription factor n=1 Tax=Sporosalibacterium faouarense TaxID=516123 RepID=UPI00141CBC33|nr:LytTR family DNA-binding domain-containing protein [Sporosalibacterium faouarense]MTI46686.1 response regulator transcription factor [Bacillota bacterium]